LVVIPVLMAEVALEATLAAPPPLAAAEEERETELPASPVGELHGSPLRLEPKAPEGDVAGMESERPAAACAPEVVDIPSNDEAKIVAKPPASPQELAVVWSEGGPLVGYQRVT